MTISYIYNEEEYSLTGRLASKWLKPGIKSILVEIAPVNSESIEGKKWVNKDDLHIVQQFDKEKIENLMIENLMKNNEDSIK